MKDIENPSAFPTQNDVAYFHDMTLRDWFAGQVVPKAFWAVNTNPKLSGKSDQELCGLAAGMAYLMADAMLRARIPNIDQHAPAATDGE